MKVIQAVHAMQVLVDHERAAGRRLVLVPTMGALHAGHLALVKEAKRHGDHVTVSIFVNPTQFGPNEDFEQYPRTLDTDLEALAEVGGVDAVFAPSVAEMYPDGPAQHRTWITVEDLDRHLCGRHRPGHFRGVATVVMKLFQCCKPHAAVFGLKDAQQFVILRRMVRDLNLGAELVGLPAVREADGLALSSRNVYLSPDERRQAVVLSQAVQAACRAIEQGEQRPARIVESMLETLAHAPDAEVQYAEVVSAGTLQPLDRIEAGQEVLAAVAVYFGRTRLIDNSFVQAPAPAHPTSRFPDDDHHDV